PASSRAEYIVNQHCHRRGNGIEALHLQPLLNPFPRMMGPLQNMARRPALWILLVAIIMMLVCLVR
ncbi:flagella biosynthesis regulator Flk, partial [Escherichia coli]|nr:flagella biosynthesis regulator Flk [Escherichia coli]